MSGSRAKPRASRARPTASGGLTRVRDDSDDEVVIRLRLPKAMAALVEAEARELGIRRSHWILGLVRNRLTGRPCFSRRGEIALFEAHSELRRMRTDLAMIRRMQVPAEGQDPPPDLIAALDRCQEDLRVQMAAIRAGFEGNLSYWRTPHG